MNFLSALGKPAAKGFCEGINTGSKIHPGNPKNGDKFLVTFRNDRGYIGWSSIHYSHTNQRRLINMIKTIGKWLYLIGLLVAVVAGLFSLSYSWLSLILLIMGILAAILFLDSNDVVNFGIRFLVLAAVAGALNSLPFVGPALTGMFTAVVLFLAPVALTLLVVYFVKKYFFSK
jgi:hypothetical protein